jgi:coronin-2
VLDEAPWIFYLSQFISGAPQRGFGVLPKRGCDTMQCEIFRFYKLHATKDMVEPISMIVPRKSEIFQDDIYPETAAPTPSLTGKTSKTKLKSRLQNPKNNFTTGLL